MAHTCNKLIYSFWKWSFELGKFIYILIKMEGRKRDWNLIELVILLSSKNLYIWIGQRWRTERGYYSWCCLLESHWPWREHFQCSCRPACEQSCNNNHKMENLRRSQKFKGFMIHNYIKRWKEPNPPFSTSMESAKSCKGKSSCFQDCNPMPSKCIALESLWYLKW